MSESPKTKQPSFKAIALGILATIGTCFASGVSAIELSRPLIRAEVSTMLREHDVATRQDIKLLRDEIIRLRSLLYERW
jgi:hypothetical protein